MSTAQKYRPRVWFIGHAHIDALWLWTWDETLRVIEDTFSSVLKLMERYPQLTFAQSSAAYYYAIEKLRPDLFAEIKKRVDEGRWIIVGGSWVEFDANIPSGESLARQFLYGQRYFKQRFGRIAEIGWLPDSFGFPNTLPQMLRKSGIKYFYTQKVLWNDMIHYPYYVFYWDSPDGSRVLTYVGHTGYSERVEEHRLQDLFGRARYMKLLHGLDDFMVVYGRGDHGGGPQEIDAETITRWSSRGDVPIEVRRSDVADFFKRLEEYKLPIFSDELYLQYHRGIFTSETRYKQLNRRLEILIDIAERFSTIASLLGYSYPGAELEELWRKILLYQFHDSISGSCIKEVYIEWEKDYTEIEGSLRKIISSALETIISKINTTGDGEAIVIFNPLTWSRRGLVELDVDRGQYEVVDQQENRLATQRASDNKLLFIAEAPPLGYRVYWLKSAGGEGGVKAERTGCQVREEVELEETEKDIRIRNARIELAINKKNGIAYELKLKDLGLNLLGDKGIRIQVFEDTPTVGRRTLFGGADAITFDAWEVYIYQQPGGVKYVELEEAEDVRIVEKGPLRVVVAARYRYKQEGRKDSVFTIHYIIAADSPFVEIKILADWNAAHRLAKLAIPLSFYSEYTAAGTPFGHVTRRNPYSPEATLYERAKYEVPFQHWIDYSNKEKGYGVSIITASNFGYDHVGNMVRISLLRSPRYPPKYGAGIEEWFIDREIADQGMHEFKILIYPHRGDWRESLTVNAAYEALYPLIAVRADRHAGPLPQEYSFMGIGPKNVILTALKRAEEGDGIVMRIYETNGGTTEVNINARFKIKRIIETNILEESLAEIPGRVTINGYDIKTLKIIPEVKPRSSESYAVESNNRIAHQDYLEFFAERL